jgi:alkaline phosphatase/streptomycin-6-phosphatase
MRKRLVAAAAAGLTVLLGVTVAVAADGDNSNNVRKAIETGKAKNVILLIGDGMGDSEITIARNYTVGAAGKLALDELPLTGQMTTYSVFPDGKPDYDPESASTSTAWSTGHKTVDGRISTSPADQDLATILELAKQKGFRTGNITTAELTDATPASPMSHVVARGCQGPANMAACPQDKKSAGGPGSIAEQAIQHQVDVLMGGGKARFDQVIPAGEGPFAGQSVIQQAQSAGYSLVTDKAGLLAAQPGAKLLGLFTSGNMSLDWGGLAATNPPSGPGRCTTGLQSATEPTLADMTTKALGLLDAKIKGPGPDQPGFFLQVEGASIDKRDHAAQPCEQIGETVDFDAAVRVALDFAKKNKDTLVIVTADHAHTSQIVEADATPAGASSILTTNEGSPMMVTYGTTAGDPRVVSQEHTGTQIRVAAQGPQAANVVGLIDQTELFRIMARALGVG